GSGAMSAAGEALPAAPDLVLFRVARSWSGNLDNESALTGRVSSSGLAYSNSLRTGDDATNETSRGLATFPLDALPQVVQVTNASVWMTRTAPEGSPFDDLGSLTAVAVDYTVLGASLFDAPALGSTATGNTPLLSTGLYILTVTDVLEETLDGMDPLDPRFQLRFAFETLTDADGTADSVSFTKNAQYPYLMVDLLVE
ncbi:MAG: hypothetical protein KC656_29660, partial [Myxococcales bacterium]|nr:hypothetical protein [Myxococcales bacterium]